MLRFVRSDSAVPRAVGGIILAPATLRVVNVLRASVNFAKRGRTKEMATTGKGFRGPQESIVMLACVPSAES